MNNEIDIIIPAYQAHETIHKSLSSILTQTIANLCQITIVNDGGGDYGEVIENFKNYLNVCEIGYDINLGPGLARQRGIETTSAPYIMFLDADDTLGDSFSLEIMLTEMKKNELDILVSNFVEELPGDQLKFFVHEEDQTWMHGKMYKREYLENIGIQFSGLRKNEDTAFNMIAFSMTKKIGYTQQATYLWHNKQNSITRAGDYSLDGYEGFCQGAINSFKFLEEKYRNEQLELQVLLELISTITILLFLEYNLFLQTREPKMVNKFLIWCKPIYRQMFKPYQKYITEQILNEAFNAHQSKPVQHCSRVVPVIGFTEFIEKLKK
jgi:glycosyltransferase involved in cell wall biosynthesis